MGTPTEQIGFQASEEYTSRMSSPRPQSSALHLTQSNTSDTHVESPLRKESFPTDAPGKTEFEKTLSRSLHAPSDTALESEIEDDDVIHVDPPSRRISKVYGGAGTLDSTEDLGPGAEDGGIHDELGYGAPILASDEVAKEPFGWELQPAVSPMNERRGSAYDDNLYHTRSGSASSLAGSRPSSRPGSIHGNLPGFHLPSSTQLEDLDEYEPLFPEDEKKAAPAKPLTAADRLKRPELKNRKFPSQDIWEDTPNSLQYTATVSTPQLPEETEESKELKALEGEAPGRAFARRQEELAEMESKNPDSFLHDEKKQAWAQNPHLAAEARPGMKQRFPSRDIWEDTPDSLQLQTTVTTPQSEEKDILSPPDDQSTTGTVAEKDASTTTGIAAPTKPQIPARPAKSKLSESPEKSHPVVPERPSRGARQTPQVDSTSPPIPAKAKPQVPARPSKPITRESSENIPLTTVASNSSAKSHGSDQGAAPAAKPKPPVPSRPVGSKIAALQGGFMSDLNKRLQLGPQALKKEEVTEEPVEEKEKAPLVDARKGRARGPARRAPAKSPAPASAIVSEKPSTLAFSVPSMLWQIDPDEDLLHVVSHLDDEAGSPLTTKAALSETPTLAANTAGEALHDSSEIDPGAEKASSPPSAKEDLHAQQSEDVEKTAVCAESLGNNHEQEPVKTSDEPPVVSQSTLVPPQAEEEDLSASTATLKPSSEDVE
jgi:Altered inheritance of mitochondria protein 21